MDDDLVFSTYHMNGKLMTQRDPEHIGPMFDQIESLLDEFPLVGVHPRQNAQNSHAMRYVKNGRIICIQGINRSVVGKVKVDQFPILADVVLNCTLLARGQSNAIITSYFQDHGPCQAPGGCSIYRTPEMQHSAINYLAERFPGYVKAIKRVTKGANWLGKEGRTDYVAQWKRLNAAGIAHLLDPRKIPHPDLEARGNAKAVE